MSESKGLDDDDETKWEGVESGGGETLGEGSYDVIVLGTGLEECVLSGLLSAEGRRVLHMDRNRFYGGEAASLNLGNLYRKFRPSGSRTPAEQLGDEHASRDYNVDLIPKQIMACGRLVQMLVATDVTRYLEFRPVAASYVFRGGRIHKVPADAMEAARSPLLSMMQKNRFKKFLKWVRAFEAGDPKTHGGHDLEEMTARKLFKKYGLDADCAEFVGHAMALQPDDGFLDRPALALVEAVQLYIISFERYDSGSPFLYPIFGLGGLPEGFSRLCAINGGT